MLAGRVEVGTIGTDLLTERSRVRGCCCSVGGHGKSRTSTGNAVGASLRPPTAAEGPNGRDGGGLSYEITRGMREVLLGSLPAGCDVHRSRHHGPRELRSGLRRNVDRSD